MAARDIVVGHPIDVPSIVGDGVRYPENNTPGDARHLAVGPEHPTRRAKGDLGNASIPGFEPRALTGAGPMRGLKPALRQSRAIGNGPWK